MTVSYSTNAAQNNNKCPHGFPIGSCPICSGMGGAPKDRNKPRKPGEMTYNECLAAWHKIQAKKEAKIQDKIDKLEKQKETALNKIQKSINNLKEAANKLSFTLNEHISKLPPIAKFIAKTISTPIIKTIQITLNIASNINQFILSTAEKLSSLLGEIKNAIDFKKSLPKLKKALKSVLTLFLENKEDKDEKEEKIKKLLKNLFKVKSLKEKRTWK